MPQLTSFAEASEIIKKLRDKCDDVLVAIDQPTIVPNQNRSRPVDGVAAALISRLRSGVQPANRNKAAMFGDNAPIWQFIRDIGCPGYSGTAHDGVNNPLVDFEAAKTATGQTHLIEVYPALALPSLESGFMSRRSAARYNPRTRKSFPWPTGGASVRPSITVPEMPAFGICRGGQMIWQSQRRQESTTRTK